MTTHSGQAPALDPAMPHLHLGPSMCPACGQDIPADKLEEISGRIAAREREQTRVIAAQLEKQHAAEKALAEAKAKADLDSERQRTARMLDETQKAADKLLGEKQAEADLTRGKLQEELELQRQSAANALESVRAEAKEREKQIVDEAKRIAELAAEQRIAAIDEARRESDATLLSQINETETRRIAAEERGALLASQLEELRQTSEADVARIREEAAAGLARTRQIAAQETEARLRDTLTAHENAVAEARAKAEEAEAKLLALTDQQAAVIETSLNAQREVLEKATEDALNAEKAKAFEERQKLSTQLSDLQRAWEKKTAEELGEGAEINLFDALKAEFPDDKITRVDKGTAGADIVHAVTMGGKRCGTIVYDSKNHIQFRWDHVSKLRTDQLAAKADHAILSTRKLPEGARQLHIHDGVILANPARVVILATLLRQHLLQIHTLRLTEIERESKTAALYELITSERGRVFLTRIDERAEDILELQEKEIKWHQINWKKQGEAIRAIQKAKADLEKQIDSIVGASAD